MIGSRGRQLLAMIGGPDRHALKVLVIASTLLIVAKSAGLAKELAIAAHYGASVVTDAYALSFTLTNWPVAVWMSISTSLFVPLISRWGTSQAEKLEFASQSLGLTLLLGVAAGGLIAALAVGDPDLLAAGRPALASQLLAILTPLALTAPLGMIAALQASWMMAHNRHANSLIDGLPSLVLLLTILVGALGPAATLAWGTVLGFMLQVSALRLFGGKDGLRLRPTFRFTSPQWRIIRPALFALALSQGLLASSVVVDQLMVTDLGPSQNSILGYANRVLLLIMTLVSTALSRALLPMLSHLGNVDERRAAAFRWAAILFVAASVAALVCGILAEPIVGMLYQRGAFGAEDTRQVAEGFRWGLLQIPPFAVGIVVAQYVSAAGRYGSFVIINALLIVIKVVGNLLLAPAFGVPGVMVATAIMYLASAIGLMVSSGLLRRRPA